jgi:4-hydroxybutyrate dehydrogenase
MIPMLQFPRVQFDFGAIAALPTELTALGIARPLLVTDQGLVKLGLVDRVRLAVGPKPEMVVYPDVRENPTVAAVEAGLSTFRQNACDGVVALGGGSVIDAAKAIALLATHPGTLGDYFGHPEKVGPNVAPLVAIPTTAGTGSEASRGAGIHPTASARARAVGSPYLVPKVAICDPELTFTLPRHLTAATGMDALTHCIEGYLSTAMNPPVDAIALSGIRRVVAYLERAVADGTDREARWHMMMAALEGGMALSKSPGPAHAVANTLGDRGLHHGVLVTLAMPHVLRCEASHIGDKSEHLRQALSAKPGQSAADAVEDLSGKVGMPGSVRALGYAASDLDEMATDAAASFFNLRSPYRPTTAEYKAILEALLR